MSVVRARYVTIGHGLNHFWPLTVIRDSPGDYSRGGQLVYHGVALPLSYVGILLKNSALSLKMHEPTLAEKRKEVKPKMVRLRPHSLQRAAEQNTGSL